ncbi:glycoside hydrolase family 13 protein [Thermanaerothrix sp.]|jgi:cyclomaltodextrinase|uniref:glycoside hydrolase family 13 protein n=1 Tax=Thermanaerothrix sp. TaxID=2972675 RepID=UPI002ADDBB0B|nr:glycoside hydrolase family 13 protein [Thermanaerothrix sp.]
MKVPEWVADAIFYQIFPDRFANGDPDNDPPNVRPWGSPPDLYHFQGGDLKGILQRLDYLLDLGITAVYLNPIFLSPSTHRYNTTDYFRIDERLGSMQDFEQLLDYAHRQGVRIILDGVFNHCGRGFFAFVDVLENQQYSAYRDWFHIHKFPLNAYSRGPAHYEAWWGIKSLPKFNTSNPRVRKYLMSVARFWTEKGIDGWRLDVPNEIDDDSFWAEFRETVKRVNPEAYLVGEIWEVNPRWVSEGHFDGLMNYPLREAILRFLNRETTASQFVQDVEHVLNAYAPENRLAMYVPLGSHDTPRVITVLGGHREAVKLAFALQFALPGAPAIYYGDEIGLPGEKDPDCRRAFPWDEAFWDQDLRAWVKRLIQLRKAQIALRRGEFRFVSVEDSSRCCAFVRQHPHGSVLVVTNAGASDRTVGVSLDALGQVGEPAFRPLLGDDVTWRVEGGHLWVHLPPYGVFWAAYPPLAGG